ncbi:MAG: hypothetical protein ACXACD_03220 [Candidatus Thorarchaeota archaeon]
MTVDLAITGGKLIMDNGYPGDIVGDTGHGADILPKTARQL